jgi:hypothetical protein
MPFLEYHRDLPPNQFGGWLGHPPRPDHVGIVNFEDEQFLCGLWSYGSIYVALELFERERTAEEEIWVLRNLRGWILQTYCWAPDKENRFLICNGHRPYEVPLRPARKQEIPLWTLEIFRDLMVCSVRIAASTPISLPSLPTSKPR